jgi:GNAT superfamily N-acetyltransferase
MDSISRGSPTQIRTLTFRDISDPGLPRVEALLAQSENFIRPTITPASLQPGTLSIVGAFDGTARLVGLAILQDFGVRSLLSDIAVIPDYDSGDVDLSLGRNLIERAQRKGFGRILSLATNHEEEARLTTLGFKTQHGERYLKRQLPANGSSQSPTGLPHSLRLETDSLTLIPEALSLWSTEPDMHLPPWEDLALLHGVVTAHGFLFGVRELTTGQLVGTLLASIQGEDAMLYHLYIAPHYRRRGVGSYLAKATLDALHERGCSSAVLCIHDERALAFWGSFGFTTRTSRHSPSPSNTP